MVPVLPVVGPSSSGKTTLIEGIVPHLLARGCRVGTIQRHSHGGSEIGRPTAEAKTSDDTPGRMPQRRRCPRQSGCP